MADVFKKKRFGIVLISEQTRRPEMGEFSFLCFFELSCSGCPAEPVCYRIGCFYLEFFALFCPPRRLVEPVCYRNDCVPVQFFASWRLE